MLDRFRNFLSSSPGFLLVLLGILSLYSFSEKIESGEVFLFSISALFCILLLPPLMELALKLRLVDFPNEERKIHREPVPIAGGMATALTLLTTFAILKFQLDEKYLVLLKAGILIFGLGLLDDIFKLPTKVKFVVQIILSLWVVSEGIYIKLFPDQTFLGHISNKLLSIFWIVGFTNAYNFIDGLDGLAGGIGILILLFSSAISVLNGGDVSPIAPALAGALVGFLIFNANPAKVFLGDSGAQFCGFLISAITADVAWASVGQWAKALFIPGLVMWILLFDILQISILRTKYGLVKSFSEWLSFTGRDHIHHRIMSLGFGHRGTVLLLWLFELLLCFLALFLSSRQISQTTYIVLIVVAVSVSFLLVLLLDRLTSEKVYFAGKSEG